MRYANIVMLVLLFSLTVQGAIHRVPEDVNMIQEALNTASDGDTIIVSPGEYEENIDFLGKDVTLSSLAPNDAAIVSSTIISQPIIRDTREGTVSTEGNGSIVSFVSGETAAAILTGFTIKGGYGTNVFENYYYGAGILCMGSSPTITHNVIMENFGPTSSLNEESLPIGYGGGIYLSSEAYVAYNLIINNNASLGGGVTGGGDPVVYCNVIADNAAYVGGGVFMQGGYLINNALIRNRILSNQGSGGGLYAFTFEFEDIKITNEIYNNIIYGSPSGYGVYLQETDDTSWYHHNNVYGNQPDNYIEFTDGATGQNGNLSVDPLFVNASDNDFRLRDDSPCIDAGDPRFDTSLGSMDIDGHIRVNGQAVDMGAYENTSCTAPIANAGPDQTVIVGQEVTLNGTDSLFCDPNTMQRFLWDQSDGPAVRLSDPLIGTPTFTPQQKGIYRFELILFDGTTFSRPDTVTIMVQTE